MRWIYSIIHLDIDDDDYIYACTEQIGDKLSQTDGENIIEGLQEREIITPREAAIIKAALQDKAISILASLRDNIRASILKNILTSILAFYD